jgi:hypothetical protein
MKFHFQGKYKLLTTSSAIKWIIFNANNGTTINQKIIEKKGMLVITIEAHKGT